MENMIIPIWWILWPNFSAYGPIPAIEELGVVESG